MIELIFLACLKADPDVCAEKVVKFMPVRDAAMCLFIAQPEMAAWAAMHPDQNVARWKCRDTSRDMAQRDTKGVVGRPEL